MARIVPSDLTRLALSGAHAPELETLATLRDTLPDDYTVFHGVHWTRQYKGRTLYGEIDFVVINHGSRVLCIEQKNGGLDEGDGGLFKDYGDARKSVSDQILRSVDSIREKFAYQVGTNPGLDIEYLVYCPDHAVKRISAAGLDRERIVDATQCRQLSGRIQAVLPPGATDIGGWVHQVHAFFRQTFEVVPDVHAHISAQERTYTRLSHGLLEVLSNIEMQPLRLHVLATAGNGKTMVARHFFDACVERDGRPLLLCFNRPLAERLDHLVANGGMVATLNYRWPARIARLANAVLPELPFTCANDLPRLGTGTVFYDDPSDQPRLVERIVGRLLNERFRPRNIVVLSCRGLASTAS